MAKKAETVTTSQDSLAPRHEQFKASNEASQQVNQTVSSSPIKANTSSFQTRDRSCLTK